MIPQINAWSQQAIERLGRDGLAMTPDNYAVYYHYFAGDMPALTAAFNATIARERMRQELCADLYEKFFVVDRETFIRDANAIIDAELRKVTTLISSSAKDTHQFGENLTSFSGKLSSGLSLDALREAVSKIAEETKVVSARNRKLQTELATVTEQLNEVRSDFDRVHKEALIDPLTEVGNRKYLDREIARAMTEARDNGTELSVLIADIDHFKKFNDTYGHLIGDHVLRLVAKTMVENLKGRDIIARYGGEEFVVLLPQTRIQDAERVANLLRASLATKQIKRRNSNEVLGVVTISLGAAEFCPGEDVDSLIARADRGLYKAKDMGRNCVVSEVLSDAKIAEIKAKA